MAWQHTRITVKYIPLFEFEISVDSNIQRANAAGLLLEYFNFLLVTSAVVVVVVVRVLQIYVL